VITCEHCGSPLTPGAIICGECGRSVSNAATRRTPEPQPSDAPAPPPLQQPGSGSARRDPAADAWLPESTLDPATRAWLTDASRSRQTDSIPVQTPDTYAPRTAPTHIHGAGSGLSDITGRGDAPTPTERPQRDRSALGDDDPEATRVVPRSASQPASVSQPTSVSRPASAPRRPAPADQAPQQPAQADPVADVPQPAPFWAPAPPAAPAPQAPPAAPSWWIDRSRSSRPTVQDDASSVAPVAGAEQTDDEPTTGSRTADAPAEQASASESSTVTSESAESSITDRPAPIAQPGDTAVVQPLVDRQSAPRPAPLIEPGSGPATCHVCGHTLEPDDIFCEECGAVRPAVTAAFTGPVIPLPVERPDWALAEGDELPGGPSDDLEAGRASASDRTPAESPAADAAPVPLQEPTPYGDPALPVPGSATIPTSAPSPADHAPDDQAPASGQPFVAPLPPIPGVSDDAVPAPTWGGSAQAPTGAEPDEDVDATRIVGRTPTRRPIVMHFSTGERFTANGAGLLGRAPRPEPGERFDELVTIIDPGKSVSKTHLEFGRDGDDLWVSDRFSGNGTVVRHIDGSIRRCEAGRRYRVERGARVDIGEQFFLVQ
jgi:hypothetical protein